MARELVAQYGPTGELSDLVVVVPTRRAVVYLQNELSLAAEAGQAVWSPRVAAMEDYMVELAGVQVEEPIALQLLLFEILRDIDPQLDFDQFVGWSALLLQDFSSLDQNLASPRKVFEYLSQAKALERWDLGAEFQPQTTTTAYFRFWDDLEKVYRRLQKRMRQDRLAYPGLAYRLAQRRVRERLEAGEELPRHVFVGLGFLSKAEERLIRRLRKAGRAEVHFDGDAFYLEARLAQPRRPAPAPLPRRTGFALGKLRRAGRAAAPAARARCAWWAWPTPPCRARWPVSCWPSRAGPTRRPRWPWCCPTKPCCCPCSTACPPARCPSTTSRWASTSRARPCSTSWICCSKCT